MIWTLAGCVGVLPFRNEPPELGAVNGLPPDRETVVLREPYVPDAPYPLELEVWDPEGDPVEVWFPLSTGIVDFPPDGTRGEWWVPQGTWGDVYLDVILADDRDPPARSRWGVYVPYVETEEEP